MPAWSAAPEPLALAEDGLLPAPVLLQCWKHHLGAIRARIAGVVQQGEPALQMLPRRLLVIGASQMDLYTGTRAPDSIAREILALLQAAGQLERTAYRAWLKQQGGYATLQLGDGLRWVLRWGQRAGRYVHLHPARYGPETVRARAQPLKTAIAALAWAGVYAGDPFDLQLVNACRQHLLGLAALRSITPDTGVGALIMLLSQPARLRS